MLSFFGIISLLEQALGRQSYDELVSPFSSNFPHSISNQTIFYYFFKNPIQDFGTFSASKPHYTVLSELL